MVPAMLVGIRENSGVYDFITIGDPAKDSYWSSKMVYVLPNIGMKHKIQKSSIWISRAKTIRESYGKIWKFVD